MSHRFDASRSLTVLEQDSTIIAVEAIWVAAEMRAGGAYAHSALMITTLAEAAEKSSKHPPE